MTAQCSSGLPAQARVYLLHFDRPLGSGHPLGRAQHYIGWCVHLPDRLADHRAGRGAKITAAANEAGIAYRVVREWHGGWALEKALKARHNARLMCPLCNERSSWRGLLTHKGLQDARKKSDLGAARRHKRPAAARPAPRLPSAIDGVPSERVRLPADPAVPGVLCPVGG